MLAGAGDDWDILADDLILAPDTLLQQSGDRLPPDIGGAPGAVRAVLGWLTPEAFIRGNISREGARRQELGFLKPILRRAFLERHQLRYRTDVRLGEDYVLYAQALIARARFKLVAPCGYVAVDRGDSLSSRHGPSDHASMVGADDQLIAQAEGQPSVQAALREHRAMVERKLHHRMILDLARQRGRMAAALNLVRVPGSAYHILRAALRARLGRNDPDRAEARVRLLIGADGLR